MLKTLGKEPQIEAQRREQKGQLDNSTLCIFQKQWTQFEFSIHTGILMLVFKCV